MNHKFKNNHNFKNEVGNKHNKLIVLSRAENSKGGRARWNCQCTCGNYTVVEGVNLRRGNTQSCGCLLGDEETKDKISKANTKHGETRGVINGKTKEPRLYRIWIDMKQRCYNTHNKVYPRYGGRGIKVFYEWKDSFAVFKNWALLNGYKDGKYLTSKDKLTIDRSDNDGNYCPANCQWITKSENSKKH